MHRINLTCTLSYKSYALTCLSVYSLSVCLSMAEEKYWHHFLDLVHQRRGSSEELDLSEVTEIELGVPPKDAKY